MDERNNSYVRQKSKQRKENLCFSFAFFCNILKNAGHACAVLPFGCSGGKGDFTENVGLSNILNSELNRRKPVEGPHGQVVGTAVVKGKLL